MNSSFMYTNFIYKLIFLYGDCQLNIFNYYYIHLARQNCLLSSWVELLILCCFVIFSIIFNFHQQIFLSLKFFSGHNRIKKIKPIFVIYSFFLSIFYVELHATKCHQTAVLHRRFQHVAPRVDRKVLTSFHLFLGEQRDK